MIMTPLKAILAAILVAAALPVPAADGNEILRVER